MLRPTLTLMIVLCSILTYSQKWSPVKILTAAGDTVRGEGILKYDSVRFRSGPGGDSRYYSPEQARLVYIDDVIFASSEFIDLSPGEKSALPDQFFMKVLLLGDLKLYYHEQKANRGSPITFFIKKGDEPAFQLIKTTSTETVNGAAYRRVNDAYRTQLANLFKDCPSVIVDSRKDYYKEKAMLELVSRYADCRQAKISFKQINNSPKPQFTFFTGADMGTMNFSVAANSSSIANYDQYPKSASSTKPFFGVQVAFGVGRKQKISFISELVYNQVAINHTSQSSPTGFQVYDVTVDIQRSCLRFNEGFRRNLRLSDNLSANIHAGLSFAFVVNGKYVEHVKVTTPPGTVSSSDTDISQEFQSTEAGFFGGAGLNYKKLGLLIRFEQTLSFSTNTNFSASAQNIYFGLGYRLK